MTREDIVRIAKEAGVYSPFMGEDEQLERFARMIERRKCEEMARKIAAMPFGDTSASFAVWVREQICLE